MIDCLVLMLVAVLLSQLDLRTFFISEQVGEESQMSRSVVDTDKNSGEPVTCGFQGDGGSCGHIRPSREDTLIVPVGQRLDVKIETQFALATRLRH